MSRLSLPLLAALLLAGCQGQVKSPIQPRPDSQDGGARSVNLGADDRKQDDTDNATAGRKYALLVGVLKYSHESLPNLKYTENDVEELAGVVKAKRSGFDEVVLLTSTRGEKNASARPTAANIRVQLKRLLKKVTKHDLVLIGLAGHGLQITVADPKDQEKTKEESFFCPADARPTSSRKLKDHEATMIPLFELFNELKDSGAGVKLLLVDACRDEPGSGRNLDVDNLPRPSRGVAALFSCKSGEKAFEREDLGKGHGVFFYHVIQGLSGKAKNNKGEVSWNSLSEYVTTEVPGVVTRLIKGGARQTPHEIKNLVGSPPILVQAAAAPAAPNPGKDTDVKPNKDKEQPALVVKPKPRKPGSETVKVKTAQVVLSTAWGATYVELDEGALVQGKGWGTDEAPAKAKNLFYIARHNGASRVTMAKGNPGGWRLAEVKSVLLPLAPTRPAAEKAYKAFAEKAFLDSIYPDDAVQKAKPGLTWGDLIEKPELARELLGLELDKEIKVKLPTIYDQPGMQRFGILTDCVELPAAGNKENGAWSHEIVVEVTWMKAQK